jgi:hypothetical protein
MYVCMYVCMYVYTYVCIMLEEVGWRGVGIRWQEMRALPITGHVKCATHIKSCTLHADR